MSDLAEQLRQNFSETGRTMLLDAADRIEQLEARLDRAVTRGLEQVEYIATLEEALQEIAHRAGNYEDVDAADWLQSIHKIAAAALAPEQEK